MPVQSSKYWDKQIARHQQFITTLEQQRKALYAKMQGNAHKKIGQGYDVNKQGEWARKYNELGRQQENLKTKIKKAKTAQAAWIKNNKIASNTVKNNKPLVKPGGTTSEGGTTTTTYTSSGGDTSGGATTSGNVYDPNAYMTNYTGITPAQMQAINKQILAYQKMLKRGPAGAAAAAGLEFDPQISALQRMMGNVKQQIPFGRNQIYSWYGFDPNMKQNPHPASVLGRHQLNSQANTAAYEGFPADMANIASGIAGAMGGGANPGVGMIEQAGSEWSGLMGALGANQGAFDNNMQSVIAQSALDQGAGYTMGLQNQLAEMRGQLADLRSQKGKAKSAYRMDALDKQLEAQATLIDMMTAQTLLPGQAAQIASGVNTANAGIANAAAQLTFNYDQLSQQNQQWLSDFQQKQTAEGAEPAQLPPDVNRQLRAQAMNQMKKYQGKIIRGEMGPQQVYNLFYQYLTSAGFTNQTQMHNIVMDWMRRNYPKMPERYPKFFGG